MIYQFIATFAGVIISFSLWFGGERFIRHQREKKAREHLDKEILDEILLNIHVLNLTSTYIESIFQSGTVLTMGQKLDMSARYYSISSGELRLISHPEQRQLIRNSLYVSEGFNHFIDNTELKLAIANLGGQSRALEQAAHYLNQYKEHAKETASYLKKTVESISKLQSANNHGLKDDSMMKREYKVSYISSIIGLAGLLIIVLSNWQRTTDEIIAIALIGVMLLFFGLITLAGFLSERVKWGPTNYLVRLASQLNIGGLSFVLGLLALLIALLQFRPPWGPLAAGVIVLIIYIILFVSVVLRKKR